MKSHGGITVYNFLLEKKKLSIHSNSLPGAKALENSIYGPHLMY
jgi:hypothetical protein